MGAVSRASGLAKAAILDHKKSHEWDTDFAQICTRPRRFFSAAVPELFRHGGFCLKNYRMAAIAADGAEHTPGTRARHRIPTHTLPPRRSPGAVAPRTADLLQPRSVAAGEPVPNSLAQTSRLCR